MTHSQQLKVFGFITRSKKELDGEALDRFWEYDAAVHRLDPKKLISILAIIGTSVTGLYA